MCCCRRRGPAVGPHRRHPVRGVAALRIRVDRAPLRRGFSQKPNLRENLPENTHRNRRRIQKDSHMWQIVLVMRTLYRNFILVKYYDKFMCGYSNYLIMLVNIIGCIYTTVELVVSLSSKSLLYCIYSCVLFLYIKCQSFYKTNAFES